VASNVTTTNFVALSYNTSNGTAAGAVGFLWMAVGI
jgi:hypothetical protein